MILPKRGQGTRILPIIVPQETSESRSWLRKLNKNLVLRFVERVTVPGVQVYTDGGFPYYRDLTRLGFLHEWVNHNQGEYVRADVHANGIEGFWGVMKRRMGCIGGMRWERLGLFAIELAWRCNHRLPSDTEGADLLVSLV